MRRKTVISLAPSSLRKVANYVLEYVTVERQNGYGEKPHEKRFLGRLEASAKAILADTSKRKLNLRPQPVPPPGN